jgi:prepilin-type N-terminal cleavage/methylation domain-containing protein
MDGMKKIQVKHHHHQSGFSLVELAVVIFIIGLIASMSFGAFKAQMVNASIRATKTNQDTIKDALVAYLGKNRRLPCPAIDSLGGLDTALAVRTAAPPPNCITNFGIVPYAELGLSKSAALDGWDNFFSYAVSPQWTATLSSYPIPTYTSCTLAIAAGIYNNVGKTCDAANAFNVGNSGIITVNTRLTNGTLATPPVTTNAVAVLISYGANGNGAYTTKGTQNSIPLGADEIENAVPQTPLPFTVAVPYPTTPIAGFFQREYTDNAGFTGGAFDDVVKVLSANDLLNPLIKDGVMQSALSAYSIQVAKIEDWAASNITNSTAIPACDIPKLTGNTSAARDIPLSLTVDPWGNTLTTTVNGTTSIYPFSYCRGSVNVSGTCTVNATYQSSLGTATFTLLSTSAASPALQSIVPTGVRLQAIYPFLATIGCP